MAEIENLYIPKKCHEKRISVENMHTNMTNGGLTSIYRVYIVHFLLFWGPDKFGLKKALESPPIPPQGDIVTFFTVFLYYGFPKPLYPHTIIKPFT